MKGFDNLKKLMYSIIIVLILTGYGCSKQKSIYPEPSVINKIEKTPASANKIKISKLKIKNVKKTEDKITGEIKNTTTHKIDYIEVDVFFYDSSGNVISNDLVNMVDLEVGQTWKFEIIFFDYEKEYDSYKLKLNTGV